MRIILKHVSVIKNISIYENARFSNQYPFLFFIINIIYSAIVVEMIAKQINKAATSVDVHKYIGDLGALRAPLTARTPDRWS